MAIITRSSKGAALTHAEMDDNLNELEKHPDGIKVPDTQGKGVVMGDGETFGWHDLRAFLFRDTDEVAYPPMNTFRGGIKALQFTEGAGHNAYVNFHVPHDYVPGSDLFIHVHWLVDSAQVTGGSLTWGFEVTYAKGHQQEAFSAPVIVPVTQNADTTQYFHMVAETALSVVGGSGNQLDTNRIEVDGVVSARLYLDSNDITVSGGGVPDPFALFVDLHYQSTEFGTLNKGPSFYGT